ncbi:MAG: SMI1/KNR4 family protein [Clostridia bacterium]|nr:SMI1/KNR4 family protein [Clostridia bacterium]
MTNITESNIPEWYKACIGMMGEYYFHDEVKIYSMEEIVERNNICEVAEYAPGYFAIGDDGGDTVFVTLQSNNPEKIIAVGISDMNPSNGCFVANNLQEWLENNCEVIQGNRNKIEYGEFYRIILVESLDNGVKDIVQIKKILNLNISSAELLNHTKMLPTVLIDNISGPKAEALLSKLGKVGLKMRIEKMNNI